MNKITEKRLLELGFIKEKVTPEESGTEKGFHYFVFEICGNCLLITCSNDETIKGGYVVEFFDFNGLRYTDDITLEGLVNFIKLGIVDAEKEKE